MSVFLTVPVLHIERISPHLDFQITDEGGNVVARVDQTSGPRPGWWKRNVFGGADCSSAMTLNVSSPDGAPLFTLHRYASANRKNMQTRCRLSGGSGDLLGSIKIVPDEIVGLSASPFSPSYTFRRRYLLHGSDGRLVGEAVSTPIKVRPRATGDTDDGDVDGGGGVVGTVVSTGEHYVIGDASQQELARYEGTRRGLPKKNSTLRVRPDLPADLRPLVLAVPLAMDLLCPIPQVAGFKNYEDAEAGPDGGSEQRR
ncbi:hypothetical protein [Thermomonospora amylolytica]|uniref:hypothetical protein n=1 Tax=Thermomonospora amylolytica TaxID=1411117 RepID=UPI000E6C4B1F|nr:hypothetical protein [Thermomonospora amylolytica]